MPRSIRLRRPAARDPSGDTRQLSDFITRARERFELAKKSQADLSKEFKEDLKCFIGKQWDERLEKARIAEGRPCLFFNKLRGPPGRRRRPAE